MGSKVILDCEKRYQYKTLFLFEKRKEEDFSINKNNNNEWVRDYGFLIDTVPMEMQYSRSYGISIVYQGFDRELSATELEDVRSKMTDFMKAKIEYELAINQRITEEKLEALKEM